MLSFLGLLCSGRTPCGRRDTALTVKARPPAPCEAGAGCETLRAHTAPRALPAQRQPWGVLGSLRLCQYLGVTCVSQASSWGGGSVRLVSLCLISGASFGNLLLFWKIVF